MNVAMKFKLLLGTWMRLVFSFRYSQSNFWAGPGSIASQKLASLLEERRAT